MWYMLVNVRGFANHFLYNTSKWIANTLLKKVNMLNILFYKRCSLNPNFVSKI